MVHLHDGLIQILKRAERFTNGVSGSIIFPSSHSYDKPFENNSLNVIFRNAGYDFVPLDFGRA